MGRAVPPTAPTSRRFSVSQILRRLRVPQVVQASLLLLPETVKAYAVMQQGSSSMRSARQETLWADQPSVLLAERKPPQFYRVPPRVSCLVHQHCCYLPLMRLQWLLLPRRRRRQRHMTSRRGSRRHRHRARARTAAADAAAATAPIATTTTTTAAAIEIHAVEDCRQERSVVGGVVPILLQLQVNPRAPCTTCLCRVPRALGTTRGSRPIYRKAQVTLACCSQASARAFSVPQYGLELPLREHPPVLNFKWIQLAHHL